MREIKLSIDDQNGNIEGSVSTNGNTEATVTGTFQPNGQAIEFKPVYRGEARAVGKLVAVVATVFNS